jgi:hypothetical protein
MRRLPDFAAIRRKRRRDENAKIHDEHLGTAKAYVDGLVEAINRKNHCLRVRGVSDEVAHQPVRRSMRATLKPVKLDYIKTMVQDKGWLIVHVPTYCHMRWLDTALDGVFACCGGGRVRLLPAALRPIRPAIPIRNRHLSSARQRAAGWYVCDNRKGWRACFPAGIPQSI